MTATATRPGGFFIPMVSGDLLEQAIALCGVVNVLLTHAPNGTGCTCERPNCTSQGKHPIFRGWQTASALDAYTLRDEFARLKFAPNLGMRLGPQRTGEYLLAIDVDEEAVFLRLTSALGVLPETVTIHSARGVKLLFTLPPDTPHNRLRNITGLSVSGENLSGPGVDVKIAGGQIIIPPSLHASGSRYTWLRTGEVACLPNAWVLALLGPPERPEWASEFTPQTLRDDARARTRAEKYLNTAVIREASLVAGCGEGLRNTTLHTSLCRLLPLAHGLSLSSGHGYVTRALGNAALAAGLSRPEIAATIASAEKWLRESGAVRVLPHEPEPSRPAKFNGNKRTNSPDPFALPDDAPEITLIQDNNSPAKCAENISTLLRLHPDWRGGPHRERLTGQILWPSPVPEPLSRFHRSRPDVTDVDEFAIQGWLLSQSFEHRVKCSVQTIHEGIQMAADLSSRDMLEDFLSALPAWDGIPRVDTWLTDLAGAEDTPVIRFFGRRWLVSAMARAFRPGCVADGVLVLIGPQGIGKNYLITTLFGDAPFVQSIGSYRVGHDVEADRIAGSCWIIHDDEMSARRSDVDATKTWVSRREDSYRPPYGRNVEVHPRRAVLICSTNRHHFLIDDENRRFWPVECGEIHIARAESEREQLLAEALQAYRSGETWVISRRDEIWHAVQCVQDARRTIDQFEEDVLRVVREMGYPDEFTMSEICEKLEIPPERRNQSVTSRIGRALLDLPYARVRLMRGGTRMYMYLKNK